MKKVLFFCLLWFVSWKEWGMVCQDKSDSLFDRCLKQEVVKVETFRMFDSLLKAREFVRDGIRDEKKSEFHLYELKEI